MPVSEIGKHNARLREVRQALGAGGLTPDGRLPVEGPHLLEEALSSGLAVSEVFVREGAGEPDGVSQLYRVPASVFDRVAATRSPQGIIALVRPPRHSIEAIVSGAGPILVLCGLQDPGNVGTIIRLADAFGCAGLIALDPTVSLWNSKVVRASAGSLFRLPHVRVPGFRHVHSMLIQASVAILGAVPGAADPIGNWDWSRKTAVLLGSEGRGLQAAERDLCDGLVGIRYPGRVESLNTASAAAIILYEATRLARSAP